MSIITTFSNLVRRYPRSIVVGLLTVIAIGMLTHFTEKPVNVEKKSYRNISVEVEEVRSGSLTRTITAVGTLIANQTIILKPEINGVVSKIHVEGGELVDQGAPLFELDDRLFRSEVKDCEAKFKFASLELKRARQLAKSNFGSTQKLDDAEGKYLIAEASCDAAQAKLEKTTIRAPFQGVIGLHNLAIGGHIGPDREIATLVDITPIKVDFKVPAEYIRFLSLGQKIDVTIDGFGDKQFKAILSGVDSKVDPAAHSINIRALMANKENLLKPGLFARIKLVVGAKDGTIIIPENAIQNSGDQEMVFKVVEGLAFQAPIITGIREGENVEVLRGLQAGDHIVTVGHNKIRDGLPVRYELNGQTYEFNEAEFKKKQQEFEARNNTQVEDIKDQSAESEKVENTANNAASTNSAPVVQGDDNKTIEDAKL